MGGTMLQNASKRELLERLIVAELISKRGEGPLAPKHFPRGGRGPTSGVRRIDSLASEVKRAATRDEESEEPG
jgi:hypothetical protein